MPYNPIESLRFLPSSVFQLHFNALIARGANATRAATLLVPILSGKDPVDVVADAVRQLTIDGCTLAAALPAASAAPSATCAVAAGPSPEESAIRAGFLARSSLSHARASELEAYCRAVGDFTQFSSMLRLGLGSTDALSRNFVIDAALPDLDLGGSAIPDGSGGDVDDEMDGRRGTEKRARLMSPPVRVASVAAPRVGASASAAAPAANSAEPGDDELPPLIPVSLSRSRSAPASADRAPQRVASEASDGDMPPLEVMSAAAGSGGPEDVSAQPTLRGFGRSVRPGGAVTPGLAGMAAPPPLGSPSSPFAGLPSCDIDMADVFKLFALVSDVAAREQAVARALHETLSTTCNQLQSTAARLSELPRDTSRLRAFVIIAAYPSLEDPAFHDTVVARLCKAFGSLRKRNQDVLSHWFATVGGAALDGLVRLDDPLAMVLEVGEG